MRTVMIYVGCYVGFVLFMWLIFGTKAMLFFTIGPFRFAWSMLSDETRRWLLGDAWLLKEIEASRLKLEADKKAHEEATALAKQEVEAAEKELSAFKAEHAEVLTKHNGLRDLLLKASGRLREKEAQFAGQSNEKAFAGICGV